MSNTGDYNSKNQDNNVDRLSDRTVERTPEDGISGMVFVISDSLKWWKSQKDLKTYLALYNAKLATGVTKKTDYLVTNHKESKSEKMIKAKALGLPIIDEDEFNYIIGRFYRDSERIVIPSWIKMIQEKAFKGCKKLRDLTIPDSVIVFEANAFEGCEKVTFHITDEAASRPEYFEIIGGELKKYSGPGGNVKIPDGVKSIGRSAFSGFLSLTGVTVPGSIKEILPCAFYECKNLGELVLGNGVTDIDSSAFHGCTKLTSVTIPDSVTDIGPFVFSGCKKLKSITIPESVTSIAQTALDGCPELTIYAPAGSTAERYAKKRKILFVAE